MSKSPEISTTRQIVGQAVKIASRDVRSPKVVRTGTVQKMNERKGATSKR